MAYLLQFGFDMSGPTGVRIEYTELICNNFKLLDGVNSIRHIAKAPDL
jgi:hypothetical protein